MTVAWLEFAIAALAIFATIVGSFMTVFRKAVRTHAKVEQLETETSDNSTAIEKIEDEGKRRDRDIAEVRTVASVALDRTDRDYR